MKEFTNNDNEYIELTIESCPVNKDDIVSNMFSSLTKEANDNGNDKIPF